MLKLFKITVNYKEKTCTVFRLIIEFVKLLYERLDAAVKIFLNTCVLGVIYKLIIILLYFAYFSYLVNQEELFKYLDKCI